MRVTKAMWGNSGGSGQGRETLDSEDYKSLACGEAGVAVWLGGSTQAEQTSSASRAGECRAKQGGCSLKLLRLLERKRGFRETGEYPVLREHEIRVSPELGRSRPFIRVATSTYH